MTVQQLLSTVSSPELTEWRAFYRLEGQIREKARKGPPVEEKVKFGLTGYKR